jgi:Flp pilus assembly protein TadB
MAQTRRKRRTKHRGTPAGTIQTRGRTGRPASPEERKKQSRTEARERRLNTPPTWKGAATRGALAAAVLFVLFALLGRGKNPLLSAALFAIFALALYIPGGYYMELTMYRRRQRRAQQQQQSQPRARK